MQIYQVVALLGTISFGSAFMNALSICKRIITRTMTVEGISAVSYKEDIDVDAMLGSSNFPIRPAELIVLAKQVMIEKGVGTLDSGACLADDFVFRAQLWKWIRQDS
jgi:hypothetical protein